MPDDLLAPGLPPPDHGSSSGSSSATIVTIAAIGGLIVAALGFALFGIGYGLGWWRHGDDETELEQLAQVEPNQELAPAAGPAFAGAELTPEIDPLAGPVVIEHDDRVLPGLEPVPEIEPHSSSGGGGQGNSASTNGSGGSASGGANARSTGPRVRVTLVLKHYEHVDVKLGGMVLSLDGDKTVKIRPGGYRIQLRKSADAPWKPAGLVDIKLGDSYRVTLLDPPFAKLEIVK